MHTMKIIRLHHNRALPIIQDESPTTSSNQRSRDHVHCKTRNDCRSVGCYRRRGISGWERDQRRHAQASGASRQIETRRSSTRHFKGRNPTVTDAVSHDVGKDSRPTDGRQDDGAMSGHDEEDGWTGGDDENVSLSDDEENAGRQGQRTIQKACPSEQGRRRIGYERVSVVSQRATMSRFGSHEGDGYGAGNAGTLP